MKRQLTKIRQIGMAVCLIALAMVASCATMGPEVQLTPDEKARQELSAMQGQLRVWWDTGIQWHQMNPNKADIWHQDIVPLFDKANKELLRAEQTPGVTPDYVNAFVRPAANAVMQILIREGVIK